MTNTKTMKTAKTGVLLINLGTPDNPSKSKVRSYLSQFLNDPRVIDIPWLFRKILVNLIIIPFRTGNSSKIYKELWTPEGSPLLIYSKKAAEKLQDSLGEDYQVHLAMRYKNPDMESVLEEMRKCNYQKIVILPMFPQYASSSTGSALEKVMSLISKWWVIPELHFVSQYYDHPRYIEAFVERGKMYNHTGYDHVLFSFHGLPLRQVEKVHPEGACENYNCEHEITEDNKYCYKAACYETTRLIAGKLGIPAEKYTVCFQSRLDKNWLEPFSDKVVEQKAKEGIKKLLVFSPAFTADCLETIIEISGEYQEIFKKNGGEKLQLVESLNDHPKWIECLRHFSRV
jgi:protoporphyrin/coproporphyrin ferrochelatase